MTDRLEMLLFKAVVLAEPNTSESPLAGGVLPPTVVQLPAVFQFASVLPTQVSVPAAYIETVESAVATSAPNTFRMVFFMEVLVGF